MKNNLNIFFPGDYHLLPLINLTGRKFLKCFLFQHLALAIDLSDARNLFCLRSPAL